LVALVVAGVAGQLPKGAGQWKALPIGEIISSLFPIPSPDASRPAAAEPLSFSGCISLEAHPMDADE
jgi:hypothetical protein